MGRKIGTERKDGEEVKRVKKDRRMKVEGRHGRTEGGRERRRDVSGEQIQKAGQNAKLRWKGKKERQGQEQTEETGK